MMLPSASSSEESEAPQWLQEKVYSPKMERTVRLVKASVDALVQAKQTVSKATVVAKSKELDPEGQGVCASAIKRNADAFAYYEKHRSYKEPQGRRVVPAKESIETDSLRIKPNRDENRARQRYLKLTKEQLVARLIVVENAFAQQQECWNQNNDELLSQLLKEEAEMNEEFDESQIATSDEATQKLIAENKQLKSEKRKWQAEKRKLQDRLLGQESLEAENDGLKQKNAFLMNQLTIATAEQRERDAQQFSKALKASKQDKQVGAAEISDIPF
ncbi:hypothetical protein H6F90_25770 [Trichocoleus sp. FACHB-591]|uniref:hypothetical protein n=1 Tax=Trichocoleus sp. FACHB-591 TaxID=2692872 RepID=UPI00168900DD|nr:hypothetical protein [Trichocoleus sp. FACHB-591]MBD2098483.1 hypothetical protein [Trichocoleus sp. FACHB-591]